MPEKLCSLCGRPIPSLRDAFQKVTGWTRSRGATGGVNAVTMRVDHDEWAHPICLEKAKRDAERPGQLSLS